MANLILIQPFFGAMGCTSAIVFTCFGAAYGTAKAGVGISAMGVLRPDLIVKSMHSPPAPSSPSHGSALLSDTATY
jgi:hypothetical protein